MAIGKRLDDTSIIIKIFGTNLKRKDIYNVVYVLIVLEITVFRN